MPQSSRISARSSVLNALIALCGMSLLLLFVAEITRRFQKDLSEITLQAVTEATRLVVGSPASEEPAQAVEPREIVPDPFLPPWAQDPTLEEVDPMTGRLLG